MDALAGLTAFALLAWLTLATWWWLGMRRLPVVAAATEPDAEPADGWPRVSLVVAARDEADTIGAAMRSWLAQDYPGLEIVIVDDRSEDATAATVHAVLAEATRATEVRLERIEALPAGWLGKTHAQALGASRAGGEWLLFADADVRLAPGALRRAVATALAARADHLALMPRFDAPRGRGGHLVLAFETAFALLLTLMLRPWLAPDPRVHTTLGIGAFGLYRRSAYERAGGHQAVRLRADDDLALAHGVKAAGGRSLVVFAPTLVAVTWYASLAEALRGLEKNAFAGLRFSLPLVAAVSVALVATHIVPFAVALVGSGAARAAGWGVVAVVSLVYAWYGRRAGSPAWYALLHPVSVVALVLALLRSTLATLVTRRIEWRGTSYALADLRRAQRTRDQSRNNPRT